MRTEDERSERRRQVNTVKEMAKSISGGRGVLLPGLWAARMSLGLTQRDLAGMVGTGQGGIHELETLARGAYPSTITKLCRALEVEPHDLMCNESTKIETGDDIYE